MRRHGEHANAAGRGGESFDGESDRAGGVPSPHWCGEAPGYNEAVGEILPLVTRFAELAQSHGDQSSLVAARVLDGLAAFLALPLDRRNEKQRLRPLNKAAAILASQAGMPEDRFPRLLKFQHVAEEELANVVRMAIKNGRDAHGIAFALEAGRELLAHLGTKKTLPSGDGEAARLAMFEAEIEDVRMSKATSASWEEIGVKPDSPDLGATLQRRPLAPGDAESIVRACARACGNDRELFGGSQKRAQRERNPDK